MKRTMFRKSINESIMPQCHNSNRRTLVVVE
jgi:hypothetical protein